MCLYLLDYEELLEIKRNRCVDLEGSTVCMGFHFNVNDLNLFIFFYFKEEKTLKFIYFSSNVDIFKHIKLTRASFRVY